MEFAAPETLVLNRRALNEPQIIMAPAAMIGQWPKVRPPKVNDAQIIQLEENADDDRGKPPRATVLCRVRLTIPAMTRSRGQKRHRLPADDYADVIEQEDDSDRADGPLQGSFLERAGLCVSLLSRMA